MAIGSVGGIYETGVRAHDRHADAAPGALYNVGGHRLHLNCTGSGSPTVVLENGLRATSANWARVTAEVSGTTRVCAYDRAGQSWSDDIDAPHDGLAIAADLHNLLAVAGEQSMMRRGLGVLPSLARLGATQVLPTSAWSSLPEPAASQVQAFASSPRGMRNMRDEQSMYPKVFEQAKALTSLDGKPLVVVTATESIDKHKEWTDLQDRLAEQSSNSQHRVADATHAALIDDHDNYKSAVQAIVDVTQAVRTEQPVATR